MGGLVNTVGSSLGLGSSAASQGINWSPTGANIIQPATAAQATTAYNQAQTGITNQQNFLAALQGQNGIGNQSSVYNQLQGVANGTGPNPAQAQLAQSTAANTANQAALMAGQRGAGQNVGLIARQAAQQGGANQQAAAGQAATMQANQSLSALNQLGGIAGQQVSQQAAATGAYTGATQSEQQLLNKQIDAQNTANIAMTTNQNNLNAAQAQQGAQAQAGVIGGVGSYLGLARGGVVPGVHNYDDGNPGGPNLNTAQPTANMYAANDQGPQAINQLYSGQPSVAIANAPKAPGPIQNFAKSFAGTPAGSGQPSAGSGQPSASNQMGTAIGKGLAGLALRIGKLFGGGNSGSVQNNSGSVQNNSVSANASDPTAQAGYSSQPASQVGGTADNPDWSPAPAQHSSGMSGLDSSAGGASAAGDPNYARGGPVPAMVSPGERYLPPREVDKVAAGKKSPLEAGVKIPGKAKVKGDSLKNDTVPKTLEEGGIVLPRSVMESKHPHWAAHKFVSNILAQQGQLHSKRSKKRG